MAVLLPTRYLRSNDGASAARGELGSDSLSARRLHAMLGTGPAVIHVCAQVSKPRVDDDGRHRRARAKLLRDADRRNDIRAGRRAREDPRLTTQRKILATLRAMWLSMQPFRDDAQSDELKESGMPPAAPTRRETLRKSFISASV